MESRFIISEIRFNAGSQDDRETGLLGFLEFVLNGGLQLGGITLRRTREGHFTLSFPARRDGSGIQRFFVRPVDDETRRELEHQVFEQLGLKEGAR